MIPQPKTTQRQTSVFTCISTHMLWIALIGALLMLASCNPPGQAAQGTRTPQKHATARPNSTAGNGQDDNANDNFTLLHKLAGPDGWAWRISLPTNRLVVFYGNPYSAPMGPIGQYSDGDLVAQLQAQAQVYADLDPTHPVVPAFDYVTPVVQPVPMKDNSWVYRMPDDSIQHYITLANSNQMLFFFDMQIGHSTIQKEVNLLWPYLQYPGVDLSLDPEFDMPPGTTPDVEFGQMKASEINWVIDQLSNLVLTEHLPPKILIIHQFIPEMLPDWQNIKLKPGVEIVTCVDGFGTPGEKSDDYRVFDKQQLIQYPGMKLFYKLDKPLMSPSDVLNLDPPPLMVMYQ